MMAYCILVSYDPEVVEDWMKEEEKVIQVKTSMSTVCNIAFV